MKREGDAYAVDPLRCEGCGVCVALCPAHAISFPDKECGEWYVSDTRFGPLVHAQLYPGQENSGPVSYTHLDVYKRQLFIRRAPALREMEEKPGPAYVYLTSVRVQHDLDGRRFIKLFQLLDVCEKGPSSYFAPVFHSRVIPDEDRVRQLVPLGGLPQMH